MTLPFILRHVYASTTSMKRCLRLFTFKTYAPSLLHHLLQHFLSRTFRLPACNSSSPISSFQKLPAIDKRYPFSSSMAYLDIFDRLHCSISALCIHCGLFFLFCTVPGFPLASSFSAFSLLLPLRYLRFSLLFSPCFRSLSLPLVSH